MPLPFEQQPKESAKAFAAFALYLSLGPERSTAAVGKKLGKSGVLMERWAGKFDWTGRVKAHSEHLALVERKAAEAVATANGVDWAARQAIHREVEWELREELVAAGRKVLADFKDGTRPGTMADAIRAFELASKLGRAAAGMPAESIEINAQVDVNFRLEVEAAIKKVFGTVVDAEVVTERKNESA